MGAASLCTIVKLLGKQRLDLLRTEETFSHFAECICTCVCVFVCVCLRVCACVRARACVLQMEGQSWVWALMLAYFLFLGPFFGVGTFLNFVAVAYNSSAGERIAGKGKGEGEGGGRGMGELCVCPRLHVCWVLAEVLRCDVGWASRAKSEADLACISRQLGGGLRQTRICPMPHKHLI